MPAVLMECVDAVTEASICNRLSFEKKEEVEVKNTDIKDSLGTKSKHVKPKKRKHQVHT